MVDDRFLSQLNTAGEL